MSRETWRLRFGHASWFACLAVFGVAGLWVVVLVADCVAARLAYPFELSSMEGCFVDHARRAAAGKPIYAPPSAEFIAMPYTPGSHYAAALFIRAGIDGFLAVRLVSLLGVVGASLVGTWLAARATRHKTMCVLVPVLMCAAYFDVDAYYDVGRPDNLMVLFCVLAVAALSLRSVFVGLPLFVLFGLAAIFTKQSAFVLLGVLLVGLLFIRWRLAILGGVALLAATRAMFAWLDAATDGWSHVYTVELPSHHGLTHAGLLRSLGTDFLGSFAIHTTAVILAVAALVLTRPRAKHPPDTRRQTFLILLVAVIATGIYSAASRWNIGGAQNVLIPYAVMSATFLPVAVATAVDQIRGVLGRAIGWRLGILLLAITVLGGLSSVNKFRPTEQHEIQWRRLHTLLARYGPPERIWLPQHGAAHGADVSSPMRPHRAAIADYRGGIFGSRTGRELPGDLVARIRQQYFAAIVVGEFEIPDVMELLGPYYERDNTQPPLTLPVFSGWHKGREAIWVPKRR